MTISGKGEHNGTLGGGHGGGGGGGVRGGRLREFNDGMGRLNDNGCRRRDKRVLAGTPGRALMRVGTYYGLRGVGVRQEMVLD